MKIVLFLVIGFILGAAVLYLLQMKDLDRLDQSDKELKKARQAFADAEIEHEQRLKEAIATLQEDYQQKGDRRARNLKSEYEEKIRRLKEQLPQTTASETTISATPKHQVFTGFEPPILATDIQFSAEHPQQNVASPTGSITEPPILAQPSLAPTTPFYKGFEPPILATDIQFAAEHPPAATSTPTGIIIDPPILAQTS